MTNKEALRIWKSEADPDIFPALTDLLPGIEEELRARPDAAVAFEDDGDGLCATLTTISADELAAVPVEQIPAIAGELERIKVALIARLSSPPAPVADDVIEMVDAAEAAKRLSLPESYIRELTRRGELPCVRNGKYVRIKLTDLRDWIERHRDGGVLERRSPSTRRRR